MHVSRFIKKIGNWIAFNPPGALSAKNWRLFEDEFRATAPVRYWLKYTFRKTTLYPIIRVYNNVMYWIRYRTIDRYHILKTGLPPGYHEIGALMLNVNFNMLKDFVEVEQASRAYWNSEEAKISASWFEKYMPFYRVFYPFRRPDLGIEYLNWEATLDDPLLPPDSQSPLQAVQAREIRRLYKWWVKDRPARKVITNVSYDKQGLGALGCLDDDFNTEAEDYKAYLSVMDARSDQEDRWYDEDSEMLACLIKIRRYLWT